MSNAVTKWFNDHQPQPRTLKFWTGTTVVLAYLLLWSYMLLRQYRADYTAALWVKRVTVWDILAMIVLLVVLRGRDRAAFRTVLPTLVWVVLVAGCGVVFYFGQLHPNVRTCLVAVILALSPFVVDNWDWRAYRSRRRLERERASRTPPD